MSEESYLSFYHKWLIRIMKQGTVPSHIAFIMDGNRRYAASKGFERKKGHESGFISLKRTLEWCLELEIKEVTVFAFAIENFKRDQQEVSFLMGLVQRGFEEMSKKSGFLKEKRIRLRICGNKSLIPPETLECLEKYEKVTSSHSNMTLNVCFAYNFEDEMDNSLSKFPRTIEEFKKGLYIENPPEIIIRTSNEIRLSNFLLHQSRKSLIYFLKENWPDLTLWSFFRNVYLDYQVQEPRLQSIRKLIS